MSARLSPAPEGMLMSDLSRLSAGLQRANVTGTSDRLVTDGFVESAPRERANRRTSIVSP